MENAMDPNASKKDRDENEIIPIEDNLPDEELSNENNVILGDETQGGPVDNPKKKKGNHFGLIIVVIIALLALMYLIKSLYLDA
ncbi:MAG: hypothetical protein ACRCX1_03365 [Bacteroidales bacterium]